MLHDIFLHLPASSPSSAAADAAAPSYLLDHPSSSTETIRKYLKRHILRSKVKMPKPVEGEEESKVMVAWRNFEEEVSAEQQEEAEMWLEGTLGAGRDERVGGMGWRWCAAPGTNLERESSPSVAALGER